MKDDQPHHPTGGTIHPELVALLAKAYLRLLPHEATNPASVGHLVADEDTSEGRPERTPLLGESFVSVPRPVKWP